MIRATGFSYNGQHVDSFGVTQISQGDGLQEEQFTGSKNLDTWSTNYSRKEFEKLIKREVLEIPVSLYFDENISFDKEQEIKEWLCQDQYCELIFDNEPNVIYYAQLVGDTPFIHNTIDSGYVRFTFKTNSAYKFSDYITVSGTHDSDTTYKTVTLVSDSPVLIDTEITVTSPQVTDLEFWNEATNTRCILSGTYVNLSADFLSEYEEIDTKAKFTPNLYDAHNGKFIQLQKGLNTIKIKGKCNYTIKYQNVYL